MDGASPHDFFRQAVGADRVATQLLWDQLTADPKLISDRTRVIGGHFGGLLPVWLGRWPRVVTLLRNPIARALSHINHVQRSEPHPLYALAAGRSVIDYCRHPELRRSVDNLQARYLASLSFARAIVPRSDDGELPFGARSVAFEDALSSLDPAGGLRAAALRAIDDLDAVGVCERFGPTLRLFTRILGWDAEVHETRLNTAEKGQKSIRQLTAEEVAALGECNAIDLEVYRHAWRRFRALCEQHGIDAEESGAAAA